MFDKTITLSSSSGQTLLRITAGTEGVKSLLLETPSPDGQPPAQFRPVTEQILMDYIEEAIKGK
jgi:hypothetical protein